MDLTFTILSLLTAVVSAIAACAAWRTAVTANRTSIQLANIEIARRHSELIPQFRATAHETSTAAWLTLELVGPAALDRLDEMSLEIRDDRAERLDAAHDLVPGDPLHSQIWGAYRFTPAVDGASADGRVVPPTAALLLGDSRRFQLERTVPPNGFTSPSWHNEYPSDSFRLSITSRSAGNAPWTVPITVKVRPPIQLF